MHLVLGTAQFGEAYGITNTRGRLEDDAIAAIMTTARDSGIRAVDTAHGYGDAERRLRPWALGLAITTKVSGADPRLVEPQLRSSLGALGVARVHACLIHDWAALSPRERGEAALTLRRMQSLGLVDRVGVSAYVIEDLVGAQRAFGGLEIAQVPVSALDRRLSAQDALLGLHRAGTRFQARSVLLQGLLATDPDAPGDPVSSATPAPSQKASGLADHPDLVAFRRAARDAGLTPILAAFAYIRTVPWVSQVVVGVTSAAELADLVAAWEASGHVTASDLAQLPASTDLDLIDPRRWSR